MFGFQRKNRLKTPHLHLIYVGFYAFIFLVAIFGYAQVGYTTDYTTTNFIVRDPITGGSGGGYSESTNFQLWGSVSQTGIGISTSANRELRAGFLYFPEDGGATPPPVGPPGGPPPSSGPGKSIFTIFPIIPPFTELPIPVCGIAQGFSRSDFNCDGEVNLQDLSILLSYKQPLSGQILSFLFSDWTKQLPIPSFAYLETQIPNDTQIIPRTLDPLAQASETIPQKISKTSSQIISFVSGVFTALWGIVKSIGTFFVNLFKF